MSAEHMIKFEMEDVLKALRKLNEVQSSDDTMDRLPRSPVHVLLYNQILCFSKEELESPIKERNFYISLADVVFTQRHAFFFTACIKKGAFHHLLSEETKLLLNNVSNPSNALYEAIHIIERSRVSGSMKHQEPLKFYTYLDTLVSRYLYKIDTEEKKQVLNLVLDKFLVSESESFIDNIFRNLAEYGSDAHKHIGEGIKRLKIDLTTKNLNNFLPKERPNQNNFSIESYKLSKLSALLDFGFKFDESNYSHNGLNLFISVVNSSQKDLCEIILPHLSNVAPIDGDWDKQNKFIETYVPKIYPNDYKFIQMHYNHCLLNFELNQNGHQISAVKKVKI